MKFLKIYILMFLIIISFFLLNLIHVDNEVDVKATLIDYRYGNDSEYGVGWHGIYKFTVDGKDYTFTGDNTYELKLLVPKTAKVKYNGNNPSDFKQSLPTWFTIGMAFIILSSIYETIKPSTKRTENNI